MLFSKCFEHQLVRDNQKHLDTMDVFSSLFTAVFLLSSTTTHAKELKSNASSSACKVGTELFLMDRLYFRLEGYGYNVW